MNLCLLSFKTTSSYPALSAICGGVVRPHVAGISCRALSSGGDVPAATSGGAGGRNLIDPSDVRPLTTTLPSSMARGRGGRSSFSGHVVTVFGATGFLGSAVVNQFAKIGSQVIIPYRGDHLDVRHLKVAGDLGQILFCPYDVRDQQSVLRALKHSNIVVNLVGRDYETKNFSFEDVNVHAARAIARAARDSGRVRRLVHVSALNASAKPAGHLLGGGSRFLRTKWLGEQAVREHFPEAVVLRPADMFGSGDRFLLRYLSLFRRLFGYIGLWRRGEETIKQPIYRSDVAQAVRAAAVGDHHCEGLTYDLVGPHSYRLSDLVDWIFRCVQLEHVKRVPIWYQPTLLLLALINSRREGGAVLTLGLDLLERECVSDTLSGGPTARDLGVKLTDLASRIDNDLHSYRQLTHVYDMIHEFERPTPAPIVSSL